MADGFAVTDMLDTLALLTPYEVPAFTRRRIGNRLGDGGYVLLEELLNGQPVISAGIGHQISFDLELARLGHVVHMFDHTIEGPPEAHPNFRFQRLGIAPDGSGAEDMTSIERILDRVSDGRDDIVLKMDIEGAEWDTIASLSRSTLRRFSMIVMEMHGITAIGNDHHRPLRRDVFGRLAAEFTLFHVHANNGMATTLLHGVPVHPMLELCYVRKDLVRPAPNMTVYPHALDPPNLPNKPEVGLWFYPFMPTACPPEMLAAEMRRSAMQLDRAASVAGHRRMFAAMNRRIEAALAPAARVGDAAD